MLFRKASGATMTAGGSRGLCVRNPRWPGEPEILRGGNESTARSQPIEMASDTIPTFPEYEWEGKGTAPVCDRNDPAWRGRTAFQATIRLAALSGAGFASVSVGVPALTLPQSN